MRKKIPVRVINHSKGLLLPTYATQDSDAVDLMACFDCGDIIEYYPDNSKEIWSVVSTDIIVLTPGHRLMIPTGLSIEVPEGYRFQIYPRSGLALKNGISITNCVGKVDSDYRGMICLILENHSTELFEIHHGDRLSQGSIEESHQLEWIESEELTLTDRGEGGFGHSGIK